MCFYEDDYSREVPKKKKETFAAAKPTPNKEENKQLGDKGYIPFEAVHSTLATPQERELLYR